MERDIDKLDPLTTDSIPYLDLGGVDDMEEAMEAQVKEDVAHILLKQLNELEDAMKEEDFSDGQFSLGDAKICVINIINTTLQEIGYSIRQDKDLNFYLHKK